MAINITEVPAGNESELIRYGEIPISFLVTSQLAIRPMDRGLGGLQLVAEAVVTPYLKDYDAIDGEGPTRWSATFDLSRWVILAAFEDARQIGGAVVAWNTPGVDMLEGRDDLAMLWDLRVYPDVRGRGVGHRLFIAAEEWSRVRGCHEMKVETQNINVPACRFYARQGCTLRTIRHGAYPELPGETQLLWYKTL